MCVGASKSISVNEFGKRPIVNEFDSPCVPLILRSVKYRE